MRRLSLSASVFASFLALPGCVAPAPEVAPAPYIAAPRPAPAPTPAPVPVSADWRDWPLTPGDWTYRQEAQGSRATFGSAGQEPHFSLRCDRPARTLRLAWRGAPSGAPARLALRTTSMTRQLSLGPDGAPAYVSAEVDPGDLVLDAMGYSRGRFIAEAGATRLVVPAWAEILRVVEDCRG